MLAGGGQGDFSEEAALDQGQEESAMCSPFTVGGRGDGRGGTESLEIYQ